MRAPKTMLIAPTEERQPGAYTYVQFHPGELVRLPERQGIYVVLVDKGEKVNVALIGGDNGFYVRALRHRREQRDQYYGRRRHGRGPCRACRRWHQSARSTA